MATPKVNARTGRDKARAPIPAVPESVKREARIGGTLALALAAGISAQTLFQLGRLIGLSAWTAWMLPGAFDIYAFESARVASRVPDGHPSRSWAVWNARIALSFTVLGNGLFHAIHLASARRGWTHTDIALTAVSAIPPIIVERLLHLQTKVNIEVAGGADVPVVVAAKTPSAEKPAPTTGAGDADDGTNPSAPTSDRVPTAAGRRGADPGADVIDMAAAGAAARLSVDQWAAKALPLYRWHRSTFGDAPNAPQLAALLLERGHGRVGASRARDIRRETEKLDAQTPADEPERALAGVS